MTPVTIRSKTSWTMFVRDWIKPPVPTVSLATARKLRRDTTEAEQRIWRRLRSGQLEGWKFRRQHPIPPYVVDFCCVEAGLVVELDGSQHSQGTDAVRTRYLESQGWRLVRYWDNEALAATDAVIEAIHNALGNPTLTPTPLPEGEGPKSDQAT